MIFHCKKDWQKITDFIESIKEYDGYIELFKHFPKRTGKQNNYQHVVFTIFAIHIGETMEYVKQKIYKKMVNRDIFKTKYVNKITGKKRKEWRSTRDLDTKETTIALDRFIRFAAEQGCIIGKPDDKEFMIWAKNEIEKHKTWL